MAHGFSACPILSRSFAARPCPRPKPPDFLPGILLLTRAIDDADQAFARAKAAGATILQEPEDRDYGSREFICQDPEGNLWCLGTYWPKVA
ncbi:VOC family protein [Labrenzia sp. VG12]|uniref:VOC family protein n=1 Tax=Labrenzia sp. VG12 TaxID=2021862 RepID=UPI001FFD91EC|nr:VOC family protein [Labrenzia sp. VG12]